jgi:cell division protein FtsB
LIRLKKPFILLWAAFLGIMIFSLFYLPSLSKYHDLKMQEGELDAQLMKLTKEVEAIREERNLLKNDPEYLEKVIRDEMGLVKPGEIVYKFVQDVPESVIPDEVKEELPLQDLELPDAALPPPDTISSGITVEARPVIAPAVKAITPKIQITPAPPRSLLPPDAEPEYPRRETR